MDRHDALLEIGCEELPADYLLPPRLAKIARDLEDALRRKALDFTAVEAEATPRRIALLVRGLAERPRAVLKRSKIKKSLVYAPDGSLTPAGKGFLNKLNLQIADLKLEGEEFVAEVAEQERTTLELLPGLFLERIEKIEFPKTMRWEASHARFARPVRWLAALYGDRLVKFTFADVTSRDVTRLHPLHTPLHATVPEVRAYPDLLRKGRVVLSVRERTDRVRAELVAAATDLGGRPVPDDELLELVVMMAEDPQVVAGAFAGAFSRLPREIVITTMREHQRYFAVEDEQGRLLPCFLAVHDTPQASPEDLRPGYERVLEARLKDAEFFFHEDLKRPLAERVPELERVLWIKGLGSLLDKTRRLERLGSWLAEKLEPAQAEAVGRAAHLSKADLVTNMVQEKEFTSLQGIMGTYYALAQGAPAEVAQALREQYQPRGAGDALPQTPAGRVLALADKFDHLLGCWGAGFAPTGAKDPYALRRAAQGVVAITLDAGYRYSLRSALACAAEGFPQYAAQAPVLTAAVHAFILGRMETELANRGYAPDLVQALLGVWTDDLTALGQKAGFLAERSGDPDFAENVTAFSRVVNILPKQTPRDLPPSAPLLPVDPDLLTDPSERELFQAQQRLGAEVPGLAAAGDHAGVFARLAEQTPLIDRFFTEVLVMDPDERKRNNRLALLTNFARLIWTLADFSRLVGREITPRA